MEFKIISFEIKTCLPGKLKEFIFMINSSCWVIIVELYQQYTLQHLIRSDIPNHKMLQNLWISSTTWVIKSIDKTTRGKIDIKYASTVLQRA